MYREHNPSILNSFLDYLRILGYSKYTIKGYNLDLLQFFNFIKDYMELPIKIKEFNIFILLHIKESDIIAFLIYEKKIKVA